jgi:integrase
LRHGYGRGRVWVALLWWCQLASWVGLVVGRLMDFGAGGGLVDRRLDWWSGRGERRDLFRRRHTPATLARAAQARTLRDIERLEWKAVGDRLGCSPATAIYLYRATSDAVLEDDLVRVDRALYLTAAMTGLRQGELLGLRWRDVDWAAQKLRVVRPYVRGKFRTPKSRTSSRAVPMADRVGRELELLFQASAYQAEDDLVFSHPHTGHPLERGQVSKRFKRTLKRAGVREVRFHDLRHTFGTRCAAAGVPLRTLQAWMGHADIKTTMVYTHYAPGANEAELVNGVFQPDVAQREPAPTIPGP